MRRVKEQRERYQGTQTEGEITGRESVYLQTLPDDKREAGH